MIAGGAAAVIADELGGITPTQPSPIEGEGFCAALDEDHARLREAAPIAGILREPSPMMGLLQNAGM